MINKQEIRNDLYHAVNGQWLKTAKIPNDRPTTGGFMDLVLDIEDKLIKDFDNLQPKTKGMEQFIKYYNMTKDFETRNKNGISDVKKYIEKLESIKNLKDLENINKEWIFKGLPLPYSFYVTADMADATRNVLWLDIPSIILPEKGYYEEGNEEAKRLLDIYGKMLYKLLDIFGYSKEEQDKLVDDTFKFDRMMAQYIKTSVELADYPKSNNPRTQEEVNKYSEFLNFEKIVNDIIGQTPDKIVVCEPKFYENYNLFLNEQNIELIRSWLITRLIVSLKSYLTEDIRQIGGMYKRALSGTKEEMSVAKYAYYLSTDMFSEIVSVYYGEKYFGKKAKEDVYNMVKSMISVYEKRLKENTWLEDETKKYAVKKLETLNILVGYPDKYDEVYDKLVVDEKESFFSNTMRFSKIMAEHEYAKWNTTVKKLEWGMSSNTVNAYYNPSVNHICFPAAILQAPFYSLTQTKSENYGGIGAVIGHEISHAFDNNGSQFDENGNLKNWWTKKDYETFDEKAKAMIDLFDGIEFSGGKINGKLTVSENIADAGGLSCALEALKNGGEYNLEEFFINWAKVWRIKAKKEYLDYVIKVDVHAPGELRANIQPRNLDDFYKTFNVEENDKMYLEKKKRVNIW